MKVWDQLVMKRRSEKVGRKTAVCTNLKKTSEKCGVTLSSVQDNARKNAIYIKKDIWMSL